MMKRIWVGVLFLLPSLVFYGQGSWERIAVPSTQYLKSVSFTDSLSGWIAGDSGTILHTTNGGLSWVRQDIHSTNEVEEVFFLDRNQGWAASLNYSTVPYGTILHKTTDGGATWTSYDYPEENKFIACILYSDSLHGWMGGRPHALVRTNDGGVTWSQATIDTSILAFFPVLSIQFYNDQYGYASGGMFDIAGVTWHTSDGGATWYAIDPSQAPADEVHSLHIFDSIHVMGAGGDPDFGYGVGMTRTSDGGWNWVYDELEIQGNAYDLDFRNAQEAWAPLGPKRKLIFSLDGGTTWVPVVSPDSTAIYDITFPDTLHGYAVGKEGAFLKYHPPVIPNVQELSTTPTRYFLLQNCPNPAKSGTLIRYTVPRDGFSPGIDPSSGGSAAELALKVFSIFGQEVKHLPLGSPPPGEHQVELDVSGLNGGNYFYSIHLTLPGNEKMVAGPMRMIIMP